MIVPASSTIDNLHNILIYQNHCLYTYGEMSRVANKGLASSAFDILLIFLCSLIQT